MFDENQRRFYGDLFDKNYQQSNEMPDKKETTAFWSNLWGKTKQHNKIAEWMPGVEGKLARHPTTRQSRYHNSVSKESCQSMMS